MSAKTAQSIPVLEVSADSAEAFDPSTKAVLKGESVAAVVSQLGSREVALSFSRRSAFIRAVRLPDAARGELSKILAVQIGQFLPASLGELAYDFRLTPDRNHEGRLVIIGSVKGDLLRSTLAQLRHAGVGAKMAVPAALGSWVLATEQGISNCAVIEQTAEGLAIDVILDGELRYSRVAPLPRSEAEVEAEVTRTFTVAGVSDLPVFAIGGMAFKRAQYASEQASREALASTGLDLGLSIEPPEAKNLRDQRKQSAMARLSLLFAAGAVALGALAYLDYSDGARRAELVERKWATNISKAKKEDSAAAAILAQQKAIQSKLDLAFRPAQRFTDILKTASNSAPAGIWLTGISAERGRPVTLRGTAKDSEGVAAYLNMLSAMPRFRDVDLAVAANAVIDETPVVQFSLAAHAVGNLPLVEDKKSAKR